LLFFVSLVSSLKAESVYTKQDLKKIFLKEVKKGIFWVNGQIYLEDFRVEPSDLKIPRKAKVELKFLGSPRIGSNVALASFILNGKKIGVARIWGYVDAKVKVVVAARPIPNRAILTEADLKLEEKRLSRLPQGVLFSIKDALGKEVKMSLKPGRVLLKSQIAEPPLIRRGQLVVIVARGKNFVVKAKGIALQNGLLNQRIKVKNISSKKIIWGRVISPEEVEVMF
jgi:flagella basal body P-ring formation protein FlgA